MLGALIRKGRQLSADPVLRRWIWRRCTGRTTGAPDFIPHHPPYVDFQDSFGMDKVGEAVQIKPAPSASKDLKFTIHGTTFTGPAARVFDQAKDFETQLALHRFAWVPLTGHKLDPTDVWVEWWEEWGEEDTGWAWHPYTVVERAINLMDFGAGPWVETLIKHAQVIAKNLEYFGDHYTGNHLANNGRGLFRIGLATGRHDFADLGARILLQEAKRIFMPSGVLREGSTHYHLLVTRWYVEAWLFATKFARPEAETFKEIASKCLSAIPHLTLPGGMPLVGDISPDYPPSFVADGWLDLLDKADAQAVRTLRDASPAVDLTGDGWLRGRVGDFTALWYVAPQGWSHMPGHGHQDLGSFELHYGTERVFVDAGRGAYGESGEAALYRSGAVHNTLLVDGQDPYPPNKPYYSDAFRLALGGGPPKISGSDETLTLSHGGFTRLEDVGTVARTWVFEENKLTMSDAVEGSYDRRISRNLVTPLTVSQDGESLLLRGETVRFRLSGGVAQLKPVILWSNYGEGTPGTLIEYSLETELPWRGQLVLEVL